jgi:hypothetical protein
MGRRSLFVLLAAFACGCIEIPYGSDTALSEDRYGATSHKRWRIERKYRNHLYEMEKGMTVEGDEANPRYYQMAVALKRYEKDARVSLFKVVVGVPPQEREVGYIERVVYPRVILYNRDTGHYEKVEYEFNYVRDLFLNPMPRGVILGNGRTILPGKTPDKDVILGHFSLETGALILLHVCPVCGAPVPRKVFMDLTRVDIDAGNVHRFKTAMVREHAKLNSDYLPVQNLPEEFWAHPYGHKCYMAFKDARDFGFEPMIPVRLKPVRSFELTGRKPVGEEAKEEGEAEAAGEEEE